MNNIEELICQSRIKEISHGSSPLIGEKERLALTAMYWHQEHQAAVEAFQETGRNLLLAQEQITALIAQLEAAQQLNPVAVNVSELEATYIGDIRLHMAAISDWKSRTEKAEAELSAANERIDELEINQVEQNDANSVLSAALDAANEKLSKPVKLPKTNGYWDAEEQAFERGIQLARQEIRIAGFRVEGDE